MVEPRSAEHRTILVVDVERFGRLTNPQQVVVREGLYQVLERAFKVADIPWSACHREDRGDGVFVLAGPEVPKARFAASLPNALVAALREHNRTHRAEERFRLRMVLHAGEVVYDPHGVTGDAINFAFRLLDAPALRRALAKSPGVLAVVTSLWFFDDVVRHCPEAEPATYRPVSVKVKETVRTGWIALPDHPYPEDETYLKRRVFERPGWRVREQVLVLVALLAVAGLAFNLVGYGIPAQVSNWLRPLSVLSVVLVLVAVVVRYRVDRVRHSPVRTSATDEDAMLDDVARELAHVSRQRWEQEAATRDLRQSVPLRVRWSPAGVPAADPASVLKEDLLRGHRTRLRARGDVREVVPAFRSLQSRQVVVVGDAGSGKSTLALLLTLGLLNDPRPGEPVPVLMSLSSWHPLTEHLYVWLARRLAEEFPFLARGDVAWQLVMTGRVMAVLDGLDELPATLRPHAIEAVDWAIGDRPLVMTCRTAEYITAVTTQGRVPATAAAFELAPVDFEDAAAFLTAVPPAGHRWRPVFATLRADPDLPLRSALASPLMVALAHTTYAGPEVDPVELLGLPDQGAVERRLLDGYIPAVYSPYPTLVQPGSPRPFKCAPGQARRWLAFLAAHLNRLSDPDLAWWRLPHVLSGSGFATTIGLANAFVVALTIGSLIGMVGGPVNGLVLALVLGLSVAIAAGVAARIMAGSPLERPRILRTRIQPAMLASGAVMGLPVGLLGALTFATRFYREGLGTVLTVGAVVAVEATILFSLLFGLDAPAEPELQVRPVELLRSDRRTRLLIGLIMAFLIGVPFWILVDPVSGLSAGAAAGVAYAMNGTYGKFICARLWFSLRGKLPLRLMAFLDDAHRRGILRQDGAVYQFRHRILQERLADRAH